MDWFIVVVGLILLAVATPIALVWWKLAKKAAPYRDERGAGERPTPPDNSEVIVLGSEGRADSGAGSGKRE